MQKDNKKTIRIGIDTATTGCVAITDGNKVLQVLIHTVKKMAALFLELITDKQQ